MTDLMTDFRRFLRIFTPSRRVNQDGARLHPYQLRPVIAFSRYRIGSNLHMQVIRILPNLSHTLSTLPYLIEHEMKITVVISNGPGLS